MSDPEGPFLQAALFCERVLAEQDGVISAIRVIDRVLFVTDEAESPLQSHALVLLLMFKAGAARGSFTVGIRREKPSGEQGSLFEAPIYLEGDSDRGANLLVNVMFEPDQQGLYWFDVLFEGQRITRIPLRAIYQRPPRASAGEGSE